jgi:hypothetical protein
MPAVARPSEQAAVNTDSLPCFGHITAIFTKGSKQLAAYSGVHWYRPGRDLPGGIVQGSMVGLLRFRHRRPERVLLVALLLAGAVTVSGCSSYTLIDAMPTAIGGLPEGTPERPTAQNYPAVHDLPPPRNDTPLNDAEKKRLKDDLTKVRDRAARQATGAPEPAAATGSAGASGSATRNP